MHVNHEEHIPYDERETNRNEQQTSLEKSVKGRENRNRDKEGIYPGAVRVFLLICFSFSEDTKSQTEIEGGLSGDETFKDTTLVIREFKRISSWRHPL